MNKLEVTKEQLKLLQEAVEFYARMGMGQWDQLYQHPTYNKFINQNHSLSAANSVFLNQDIEYQVDEEVITVTLNTIRKYITGDDVAYGIHHEKVDESCRVAFDLLQHIRNAFWKVDEHRHVLSVASTVEPITKDGNKIKVTIE